MLEPFRAPRTALWEAVMEKHRDVSMNGEVRLGRRSLERMLGIERIAQVLAWEGITRIYVGGDPPIGLVPFPALALGRPQLTDSDPCALVERFQLAAVRPVARRRSARWTLRRGEALAIVADADLENPLPNSDREREVAEQLAQTVCDGRLVTLRGKAASWTGASRYFRTTAWLHVYAHGESHTGTREDAGLLLGDGWLRASTIAGSDLTRLQMAFLSSCWVADQPRILGRSDVGVVDAFLMAGARSCIACLWRVNTGFNPLPAALVAELARGRTPDVIAAMATAQRQLIAAQRGGILTGTGEQSVAATTLGYLAYVPAGAA